MRQTVSFTLNGKPTRVTVDGERKLLWVLRTDLGLTGTKFGCGASLCGACTVLVGNEAVRSCQVPVKDVAGKRVTTIEGLSANGKLDVLQRAFVAHNAAQCGFCTPGMILTAHALLASNTSPSDRQILDHMDGNLCRCGNHTRIVAAIKDASKQMKGGRA
jgi:aerobic-type carbon monoxide dehydrogenase small subunit (CoxS/CutS family)